MSRAKVIQVIETGSLRPMKGGGQKHVVEYWSLDGALLATCDPDNLPKQECEELSNRLE